MTTSEPRSEYDNTVSAAQEHMARFEETVQLLREALQSAERRMHLFESFDVEIAQAIDGALEDAQRIRTKAQGDAEVLLGHAHEESAQTLVFARQIRERCQRIFEQAQKAQHAAEEQAATIRMQAEDEARATRSRAYAESEQMLARARMQRDEIVSSIAMLEARRAEARHQLDDLYAEHLQRIREESAPVSHEPPPAQPSPPPKPSEKRTSRNRWLRLALSTIVLLAVIGAAFVVGLRAAAWLP